MYIASSPPLVVIHGQLKGVMKVNTYKNPFMHKLRQETFNTYLSKQLKLSQYKKSVGRKIQGTYPCIIVYMTLITLYIIKMPAY